MRTVCCNQASQHYQWLLRQLTLCLLVWAGCEHLAHAELRAGAAKTEMTPPLGVSLDGPISKNGPVIGVHDSLYARALVLDDGATQLAIVVCDACVIDGEVMDAAKRQAHTATGIPMENMLVSATHTHAAPRLTHIGREPQDDDYHAYAAEKIAAAVIAAANNLRPAAIGHGSFERGDLLACRRFLCAEGSVAANPFGESGERIKSVSGSSTDVLKPAGPVDPQFSILFVQHTDGSPLALLGNFSVHYSGGYQKGLVSADYIGAFCKEIESRLPAKKGFPGMVGIMSNGTSGNTGSFQSTLSKKFAPFEAMEFYGRMLANEAIAATQEITVRRDLELEVKNSTLSLNTRRPDKDRLDWAEQVIAAAEQGEKQSHPWSKVYAQETLHLADYPAEMKIPLQVMRIGDIAIAACPCEVFAETGLMLKESSSLPKTFTMELANGYGGYLPPRKQHRLGGYETWPARSSFLEVNAEEKIRTGLVELLRLVAE